MTEAIDPVTRRLGWRTRLKLKPFIEATELEVESVYKLSKLSLYTVLVGSNQKDGYQRRSVSFPDVRTEDQGATAQALKHS
jgi:hypothetical protein